MLARPERGQHQRPRRVFAAADQFDDHIEFGLREAKRVIMPIHGMQLQAAIPRTIPRGNGRNLDRAPRPRGNQRGIIVQHAQHTAAYGSQPRNAHPQR